MKTSTRLPLSAKWLLALTATAVLASITSLAVEPAPGTDSAKAAAAPSAPKATSSEIASPAPAKDDTKASADAKADPSKDTYYLSDYLSTTLGTVDAQGVIDQMETDAFGAPLADGRAPTRFTGKPYDEDMGAYIFPYRNYRPDEARWMTPDPSGFPDGPNNRVYLPNPMREIDPFGLYSMVFTSPAGEFAGGTNLPLQTFEAYSFDLILDHMDSVIASTGELPDELVLMTHGSPGIITWNGTDQIIYDLLSSTYPNDPGYQFVSALGSRLASGANIYFASCYSGEGAEGGTLMSDLTTVLGDAFIPHLYSTLLVWQDQKLYEGWNLGDWMGLQAWAEGNPLLDFSAE